MSKRSQGTLSQLPPDEPPQRNKCTSALCVSWKVFTCIFSHLTLVTLVVAYCILGAFTFENLESDQERKVKRGIKFIRGNVTTDIWRMTTDSIFLNESEWTDKVTSHLRSFEGNLIHAMRTNGWDGIEDDEQLQWTFSGALFYSIIVITTIGYGHIAPKTPMGKVSTIFYAILGIPLMLLCLSNIGDIMASSFRFIYWRVCCFACTREPKRKNRQRSRGGTVRQRNFGRSSQLSPIKRSIRNSQRSADSGIDPFYETTLNHAHSDTELRYNSMNDRTAYDFNPRQTLDRLGVDREYSGRGIRNQRYPRENVRGQTVERERSFSDRRYRGSVNKRNNYDEEEEEIDDDRQYNNRSRRDRDRDIPGDRVRGRGRDQDMPNDRIRGRERDRDGRDEIEQRNSYRNSRNSKYSDISPAGREASVPRSPGVRAQSLDPKGRRDHLDLQNEKDELKKTPVLCNKYAFEIIDDPRSKKPPNNNRSQSLPRHAHRRRDFLDPMSSPPSSHNRQRYNNDDYDEEDDIEMQYARDNRRARDKRRSKTEAPPSARIMSPMGFVVHRQAKHMSHARDNDSYDEDWDDDQDLSPRSRPVPIWLCVCLVVGYIIAGAFFFERLEKWNFLDSAYFCFITLTTIGFGDFVPAQGVKKDPEMLIALCSLYLLFGIALLAMSFNLVQEEVIANVKSVARRLGILKEEEID